MARLKLTDCLGKTRRLPREVKRALIEKTSERAETLDIHPTVAARQVVTEMRDQVRDDIGTVEEALAAPEEAAGAPPEPEIAPEAPEAAAEAPEPTVGPPGPPAMAESDRPQAEAVEAIAKEFGERMPHGPQIKVQSRHAAAAELQGQGDEATASEVLTNPNVEAYYDERSDTVVLIPENIRPRQGQTLAERVGQLILHEAAGHGGLMRLFSDGPLSRQYRSIINAVFTNLAGVDFGDRWATRQGYRTLQELARKYGFDLTTPEGVAQTVEEHLARLAEDPAPPKWFDGIVGVMTQMLRQMGFNAWTDADTRTLLAQARDQVGLEARTQRERASSIRFAKAMEGISGNPERERGFITSVKGATNVAPSLKDRIAGVYAQLSNAETVAKARAWINEVGINTAFTQVLSRPNPSAQDYAAGIELINRLEGEGRSDDAAELVMSMAGKATSQGQAIQALSLLSKLTKAGIQFYAAKSVAAAIEKSPRLAKMHAQVQDLRQKLKAVRDRLAERAPGGKNIQERITRQLTRNSGSLWGRYKEGAVKKLAGKLLGPQRPRGVPSLEAFTQRLVKQLREQLPAGELAAPGAPATRVDEASLIGEAVRNFDKYKQVWQEAQAYVQDMFKDHPEALESLDKYLGQILERPFSQKSVGRAVGQVQRDLNASIRDVLKQSGAEKQTLRDLLKRTIIDRAGLDGDAATELAEAIGKEFDSELQKARDYLLKQMTRVTTNKKRKSELEKLIELNNAGALDDSRFFPRLSEIYGIPTWTPELSAKVAGLQREYEAAKTPALKLAKGAEMFDAVAEMVPKDVWGRVAAYQNIAMLLNPKTVIRNVIGNTLLFAVDLPVDAVSAWLVDPFVGIFTGKRSRRSVDVAVRLGGPTLTRPIKDFWEGYRSAKEAGATKAASLQEGLNVMVTLARLTSRGKYDLSEVAGGAAHAFSPGFMRHLEDFLTGVLGPFDRAFHSAAFDASIIRQMKVAEAEGKELIEPTQQMIDEALFDAAKAIYQNENAVSKAFRDIKHGLNRLTGNERWGIGSIIVPFAQVPAAILVRGAAYTPFGAGKALYELGRTAQIFGGHEFNQKEFVDGLSRSVLGTAGLVATGAWLYGIGVLSSMADEDDDLEAMRQAAGLGKYRINVSALKRALLSGDLRNKQQPIEGDITINYDWAQPLSMPLAMGGQLMKNHEDRESKIRQGLEQGDENMMMFVLNELATSGQAALGTIAEQPMLQGFQRFAAKAVGGQQNVLTALGETTYEIPGMFLPTFVKQVGQLMDNQVRELAAGGRMAQAANRLVASIPGMSERYPPRYDVFGEAQARYQYGGNSFANVMLNPAFVREVKDNAALREMEKIYQMSGERAHLPRKAGRSISGLGTTVELTNAQISAYQDTAGDLTIRAYTSLAASPTYAAAAPHAKARALVRVMDRIHKKTKQIIFQGNPELVKEIYDAKGARRDWALRAMEEEAAGP